MIDTHTHIDGEEFAADFEQVIGRAKAAGAEMLFVPGINVQSLETIPAVCAKFPDFLRPMFGLHPEDVNADWRDALEKIKPFVEKGIAVGEIGLDYYWSREFEQEQLEAFEEQVRWSIEMRLPLMIHCRKAQNELVGILRKYERELIGGVFHCFTGNVQDAEQLLAFENFMLGIGGVLTFKKSNLPETLRQAVPLNRIVLETDAPYMAPVPMRGNRNESAYLEFVIAKLSEIYGVSAEEIERQTTVNAKKVFPLA